MTQIVECRVLLCLERSLRGQVENMGEGWGKQSSNGKDNNRDALILTEVWVLAVEVKAEHLGVSAQSP